MGNTEVEELECIVLRNSSSRPKDDEEEEEDTIGRLVEDACPARVELTDVILLGTAD
jgi:hypothetical protein